METKRKKIQPIPHGDWIVLNQSQIDEMIPVMDYILKNQSNYNVSVRMIMDKFCLSPDEYNMIFDLCMPHIREKNKNDYWKVKYITLRSAVTDIVRKWKKCKMSDELWNVLEKVSVSDHNVMAAADNDNEEEIA